MKNAQSIVWSQLLIDYKCEYAEGGYQFSRGENGEPTRLTTKFLNPDILARKFTSECLRDFLSIHPGVAKYKKELVITGLEDFHSKWGVFPNTDNEPRFKEGSEAILLLIVKKRRYLTRYNPSEDDELNAKRKAAEKDEYGRTEFNLNVAIGIKDMGTQVVPCFQPTNLFQALEIALILGWHRETPTECKSSQVLGEQRPTSCSKYFPRTRRDKEFCSDECRGSYHRTIKQKEKG
jgi:hypothetical protein